MIIDAEYTEYTPKMTLNVYHPYSDVKRVVTPYTQLRKTKRALLELGYRILEG